MMMDMETHENAGRKNTSFCSNKKLVQATRFFDSRPIFPASPSKIYLCIDKTEPDRNVLSLASSRIENNSWEEIANLEGLASIISCKEFQISYGIKHSSLKLKNFVQSKILSKRESKFSYQDSRTSLYIHVWQGQKSWLMNKCSQCYYD